MTTRLSKVLVSVALLSGVTVVASEQTATAARATLRRKDGRLHDTSLIPWLAKDLADTAACPIEPVTRRCWAPRSIPEPPAVTGEPPRSYR